MAALKSKNPMKEDVCHIVYDVWCLFADVAQPFLTNGISQDNSGPPDHPKTYNDTWGHVTKSAGCPSCPSHASGL